MILFRHEMKRGRLAFLIWTLGIASMIIVCMVLYPEMKQQMDEVTEMFSNMGGFTAAFGMDQVNFGEVMGFYAVECGNILGLGGAFYAALLGIMALSKEEKEHTAEFLLTHPVSRLQIVVEKWLACIVQLLLMNGIIVAISVASFTAIGEDMEGKAFVILHLAFLVMQLEIMSVCFGISAFIRGSGMGAGIGLATVLYFLNIIRNISEKAEGLKYVTPFAYADASDIVADVAVDEKLLMLGVLYGVIGVLAALIYYRKKDISV
ncbi:MAG: ABC transporter permease subunit [Dorea sp.]|nr:ABC transporter permease subunit [Dorea sp.]